MKRLHEMKKKSGFMRDESDPIRDGPKGKKGCGKLLTGVGTACADSPPMPPTAFGTRLTDGLSRHQCNDDG